MLTVDSSLAIVTFSLSSEESEKSFCSSLGREDLFTVYSYLMQRCRGGRAGLFLEMPRGQAGTQWTKAETWDRPVRYKNSFCCVSGQAPSGTGDHRSCGVSVL